MQFVVEALERTPTLRALVCNVEMPPAVLLDRQLARLAGIDLTAIRHRRLGPEHAERHRAGPGRPGAARRAARLRPPALRPGERRRVGRRLRGRPDRARLHPADRGPRRARRPARGGRCLDGLPPPVRRRRGGHHRRRRPGPLEGRQGAVELRRGAEPGELPRDLGTRIRGRRRLHPDAGRRRRGGGDRPRRPEAPEEPARRDAGHRPGLRPQAPAVHPGRARRPADAGKLQSALRGMWNKTPPARDGDGDEP